MFGACRPGVGPRGAYGIPPEQVVGSSINAGFELRDGMPVLVKLPEIEFVDDKEGWTVVSMQDDWRTVFSPP